jgi:hypothetical protein
MEIIFFYFYFISNFKDTYEKNVLFQLIDFKSLIVIPNNFLIYLSFARKLIK